MTNNQDEQRESRGTAAGLGGLFDRLKEDTQPVREQLDRNARALAQSALTRLDVVSRAEFDAQAAVLQRTRDRVELLEAEVERLTQALEAKSAD